MYRLLPILILWVGLCSHSQNLRMLLPFLHLYPPPCLPLDFLFFLLPSLPSSFPLSLYPNPLSFLLSIHTTFLFKRTIIEAEEIAQWHSGQEAELAAESVLCSPDSDLSPHTFQTPIEESSQQKRLLETVFSEALSHGWVASTHVTLLILLCSLQILFKTVNYSYIAPELCQATFPPVSFFCF